MKKVLLFLMTVSVASAGTLASAAVTFDFSTLGNQAKNTMNFDAYDAFSGETIKLGLWATTWGDGKSGTTGDYIYHEVASKVTTQQGIGLGVRTTDATIRGNDKSGDQIGGFNYDGVFLTESLYFQVGMTGAGNENQKFVITSATFTNIKDGSEWFSGDYVYNDAFIVKDVVQQTDEKGNLKFDKNGDPIYQSNKYLASTLDPDEIDQIAGVTELTRDMTKDMVYNFKDGCCSKYTESDPWGTNMFWFGVDGENAGAHEYNLKSLTLVSYDEWKKDSAANPGKSTPDPVVPEPMTLGLVGLGLAGIGAFRRRSLKK